jgi:hypothetical protein
VKLGDRLVRTEADLAHSTASLDRLAGLGVSQLLPGHGEPIAAPDDAVARAKGRGPT